MRGRRVWRVVGIVLPLICVTALSAAARRDLSVSDEPTEAAQRQVGVYRPKSIADAIVHIAAMRTYLYHEARCTHLDRDNAAKVSQAMTDGVKKDFPGWWVVDDLALAGRSWSARRRIDDYSCNRATVDNPEYMVNNIGFYANR